MRLDIGCGAAPREGFTGIDREAGGEAYPLKLNDGSTVPDDSVDEIYASHVLEHITHRKTQAVIDEWARVLKPGGRIRIAVPDFCYWTRKYQAGEPSNCIGHLFGGQDNERDFHAAAFDEEYLSEALRRAGLVGIRRWESDRKDCSANEGSLNLEANKSEARGLATMPKIAAVMSMPRLCFSDNMFTALAVVQKLGIPFTKTTGANWGQCHERAWEPFLTDGTEWILAVDYDTVCEPQDVMDLIELTRAFPRIDALAPMQIKREEDVLLAHLLTESGEKIEQLTEATFEPSILRCSWAHFGLTLIRVEMLRTLKKPWFWEQPSPRGDWGEGRVDNDIYFWKSMNEQGFRSYIAPHVCIGHLELVVKYPTEDLGVGYANVSQVQKTGKPEWVRR